jgi:hypothetical protein
MLIPSGRCCGLIALVALCSWVAAACGQDPRPSPKPRLLSPGVLTVISPERKDGETATGPVALVEIITGNATLDWTPNFEPKSQTLLERAKRVHFNRSIWCLEFAFKPLRMIEIEIPQANGQTQRKLIWYMVYRVKNVGYEVYPTPTEPIPGLKIPTIERVNYPTRPFIPRFVLESLEFKKLYQDTVIPAAKRPIQRRENPGVELYDTVEITQIPIPLSDARTDNSVWGYATWEDIDPRIDFFSIYVHGLTNAFTFADPPGAYKPGDPPGTGRLYASKALQLNFWRPGDTLYPHEEEIRYGVPVEQDSEKQRAILNRYGLQQRLDYQWVYR